MCNLSVHMKQLRTASGKTEDSRDLPLIPLKKPWKGAIVRVGVHGI
jgi:hypothetical protein